MPLACLLCVQVSGPGPYLLHPLIAALRACLRACLYWILPSIGPHRMERSYSSAELRQMFIVRNHLVDLQLAQSQRKLPENRCQCEARTTIDIEL